MSNSKGKVGEQLLQQILQNKGYKVQDVSTDPNYYYKGDFLVSKDNQTKIVECKFDYKINKTGNLYLEIANANSQGCNGWYEFCTADYVAYGDAIAKKFYIIPLPQLRERVKKIQPPLVSCGTESVGYKMSLQDVKNIIEGVIEL